ncbi:hypothetical protein SteCoe_1492 [Stentor coeruleus]|uniref:Chitin-binding type-2 domain-containing protein n=1 Tax=Stentor coeruleus TaxID=5963 RepID=A0A1R2D1P4_9CILI|nr:hypothetical protein SteCoe_1492 [Stentor coeruleus]
MLIFILSLLQAQASECLPPNDCSKYCRIQYQGQKSFYNTTDGNCYSIPICSNTQYYNPSNNLCIEPGSIPNIPTNPIPTEGNSTNDKQIICVHGKIIGKACLCDDGYYTSTYQDPSQEVVIMCDSRIPEDNGYVEGKSGEIYLQSPQKIVNEQMPLDPLYKIVILIGLCIISCIGSCCWVRKLKKKLLL